MKKRIWELDAFRGICILGVVVVHLIFDLVDMYRIIDWDYPDWFMFVKNWGGVLFLLLSGTSITLGHHHIRRGLVVFGCGMLITLVTFVMSRLNMLNSAFIIRFGVLQCLGSCMLLWSIFRRLPKWALAAIGLALVIVGLYFSTLRVETNWLYPIGLITPTFSSGDYFPLLPHFGFFLIGAAAGRVFYAKKQTLLSWVNEKNILLRPLIFLGRHSLWVYLLHQPILNGLCLLLSMR